MSRYLLVLFWFIVLGQASAQVVFVAADASGNNDGTSWTDAYVDLQDAVTFVNGTSGSYEIWIKAGTYYPTATNDRTARFTLNVPSVRLYGGFNGTETNSSQRNPRTNKTIISGNIGDPNLTTDNSYSLVEISDGSQVLDGLTIQDIYGDSNNSPDYFGAVYTFTGSSVATISNCVFKNNFGVGLANSLYLRAGVNEVSSNVFMNNEGPAVMNVSAGNSTIESNLFYDNTNSIALDFTVFAGNNTVVNNTIYGNDTGIDVEGNGHTIANNILWNNVTEINPGSASVINNFIEQNTIPNNFANPPGFKDEANKDFSLTVCSLARNNGVNNSALGDRDVVGNPRRFDTTIDVGAYEVQGFPISINAVETLDIACFGESTGQIALGVTGGVGTLQYSLDGTNFQSSPIFTDLPSGSYTIEVTDNDGCLDMTAVSLNELSASVLEFTAAITDITCPGASSGEMSISAIGGTAPYSYSIDGANYQSGNVFADLKAGIYEVSVIDGVGCEVLAQHTIEEPSPFTLTGLVSPVSCYGGSDGEIDVTATGGNGRLTNAKGSTSGYLYNLDNGSYGLSSVFSGLSAGDYLVGIKDANGCEYSETVTVSQPDSLAFGMTESPVTCYGETNGEINVSASGGTQPYEYSIDGVSFQLGASFTALTPGRYGITVRDANQCTITDSATIAEPDILQLSVQQTNDNFTLTATGGTEPYAYSLDGTTFQSSNIFDNLAIGNYTFMVRDANECEESSASFAVVLGTVKSQISIYPNPVVETLNVDGEGFDNWALYNLQGMEVARSAASSLDVQHLPKGLYLLTLYKSQKPVHHQKLVIN